MVFESITTGLAASTPEVRAVKPMDISQAHKLAQQYGSPVYIYDEAGIRQTASILREAFREVPGYRNYFAIKATPTPAILRILHEEGMGFDCSSRAELEIMRRMGISGEDIFYTSNNTPKEDFEAAVDLRAIINIDDLTQVSVFLEALGDRAYDMVAIRYNPGNLKKGNEIIGDPIESKYGMRLDQIKEAVALLKRAKIKKFALHTMVASNERRAEYFKETTDILVDAARAIEAEAGIQFSLLNLGGGFGVDYSHTEYELDLGDVARSFREASHSLGNVPIVTENGRFITGPHGYLVTTVRYKMEKYKKYIGVDASMHNLMRPGMYGAYHKITVLGKEGGKTETFDVVGSLCENNDKFALDRALPATIEPGDILIIHDAGAHGHAMGFNYNGLLRSAEVLLCEDGTSTLIRRAETVEDYLETAVFDDVIST